MVREDGTALHVSKDAMRRLGVVLRDCPRCGAAFSVGRTPRWWLTTFVDGELIEGTPEDDLFCSSECAYAERDSRVASHGQHNEHHTYFVNEDNETQFE